MNATRLFRICTPDEALDIDPDCDPEALADLIRWEVDGTVEATTRNDPDPQTELTPDQVDVELGDSTFAITPVTGSNNAFDWTADLVAIQHHDKGTTATYSVEIR